MRKGLDAVEGASHAALQLAALVEASDDAIYGRALDRTILSWNRGAEQIFGYTATEAIGSRLEDFVPADREAELDDIMSAVSREEKVAGIETVRCSKDGRRVDVLLITSPSRDEQGNIQGTLVIARDITEQKRSAQALEELRIDAGHRGLVLETAGRVALDILASQTGVEALRHIAEAARTLAGAQYAALGVARPEGLGLMEFVTVGLTPEQEAVIGPRPTGKGVLGVLLHRQEPLRIDRLADHPHSVGFPPNHPPMDSFLGVPIRRGDLVLGSLYLSNKVGGGSFTEEDEAAVQALGAHAAVAIHNLLMLTRQRSLVSGLMQAQEEERRAVAYELHDGLTQYVMAAHAHMEACKRAREAGKDERETRELDQGIKYLKEAVLESRRLVNGLRALALDDLGLSGALEQLVAEEKARAGWVEAEFLHNIAERRFDRSVEVAAYRVAQEAMTNARKHAETSRVRLALLLDPASRRGGARLVVELRDWGKGFVPEEKARHYDHVGLHGMAERAALMSGTLDIRSAPGKGTTVRAEIPIHEGAEG